MVKTDHVIRTLYIFSITEITTGTYKGLT